jgi:hypothetical protein
MKSKRSAILTVFVLVILISAATFVPGQAAGGKVPNTKSPMIYHDGGVVVGTADIYLIWYGCWTDNCGSNGSTTTVDVVSTFASSIGGTPYFQLNALYPNSVGQTPSGGGVFGGAVSDNYSHGVELTAANIEAIVGDHIVNGDLPADPTGIYVVIGSADVGSTATGFCTTVGTPPPHGTAYAFGTPQNYTFLGNPNRCPAIAAPQFIDRNGNKLPTPNGDFPGDAIASDMAHALSTTITDPYRRGGWYDKYGLESADKCQGAFGTTYTTANGARANVRWYGRDYLIQENWVNDKKGGCAMSL